MSVAGFSRSIAISVGIDQYAYGIPKLQTAANDARGLAQLLKAKHGYHVMELLDETTTRARLQHLLQDWLPKQISPDDRLLFYFAGHGLAMDGDDGPAGYLVPQDGKPGQEASFIPMRMLHDALTALPCRHALIILDCCFSGAFRWSSTRDIAGHPEVIYKERFDRFIQDPAWQVITSAAYDQTAFDVLEDHRGQGRTEKHSPFSEALFDALGGSADRYPAPTADQPEGDGVITATELYLYLRDRVEIATEAREQRQTPGIWPLRNHDKGEYIFLTPDHALNLPPAPELNAANNPYRGLESFDEAQAHLFFGRDRLVQELQTFVEEHPLTVVLGPSGTGKSSLVKAGLLPALRNSAETNWQIIRPFRPGDQPVRALSRSLSAVNGGGKTQLRVADNLTEGFTKDPQTLIRQLLAQGKAAATQTLLVIDQFEELITQCRQEQERAQFLALLKTALDLGQGQCRVIVTLRSDFEPQFTQSALSDIWMQSRFLIKPMAQNELRQAIAAPAAERVMYFEPHSLVDQLINEVVQMPGALPLLSFTLSELYLKYLQRRDGDRALTQSDYEALGGVAGSLTQRATQEYDALVQTDAAYAYTVKQVMLRMVAVAGGELARRRVPRSELVYASKAENARVSEVIRRLTEARLIVEGQDLAGEPYVEPAHDALVQGWHQLQRWKNEEQENLTLQRLLTPAAREWESHRQSRKANGLLWDENPRLNLLKETLSSEQCWLNRLEREFVEQSFKHRRRQQIRFGSIAASVFLALSGLTTFAFMLWGTARANETMTKLQAQADRAEKFTETTDAAYGLVLAIDLAVRSQNIPSLKTTVQSVLFSAVQTTRELNRLQAVQSSSYEISQTVVSPESQRIVIKTEDGSVHIWDSQSGQVLGEESQNIDDLEFTSNKHQVTNFDSGKELWHGAKIFVGDRSFIATIGPSGNNIEILNSNTGETIRESEEGHESEIVALAISPDGSRIASASGKRYWRDDEIPPQYEYEHYQNRIQNEDYSIRIWNVDMLAPTSEPMKVHKNYISSLEFSPDGTRIVTGSMDGTIRLWNASTGKLVEDFMQDQLGSISSVSFSSNRHILSIRESGLIQLWDTNEYDGKTLISDSSNLVRSVMFSPDGTRIASVSGNYESENTLRIWDWNTSTGNPISESSVDWSSWPVVFSQGGEFILGTSGTEIQLWDSISGQSATDIPERYRNIGHVGEFSLNGKFLFSRHGRNSIRVLDLEADKSVREVTFENFQFSEGMSIHPSSNNQYIVTYKSDSTMADGEPGAQVWHIQGDRAVKKLDIQGDVSSIALSPNNMHVVIAVNNRPIRIWNTETGKTMGAPLEGHQGKILDLVYSSDSRLIASSDENGIIRLWNSETGQAIGKALSGHEGKRVGTLAFSPSGDQLVSGSDDGTVRLWDLSPEKLLATACRKLRYHSLLNQPETLTSEDSFIEIANRARSSCQEQFWQDE